MTETPPPPSGEPEGGTPPPPPNPYGSEPTTPPAAPQNPYSSAPPPPASPYAGNPPSAGQTPYGATPFPTTPGPTPVAGAQPGDLLPRFFARLIDGLILAVVDIVVTVITNSTVAGVIGGIIYLGYYAYLESSRGQTIGKQVLNLHVQGASGANPTMEEALRRNAWAALGIISAIPILGWIASLAELAAVIMIAVTISQDALRRGWHDKFANTSVVKSA